VADFGDQKRIAEFLQTIHQTRIWLDSNFADENFSPKLVAAVTTLRAYLRHCHRGVLSGRISISSFDRRKREIRITCVELWQAKFLKRCYNHSRREDHMGSAIYSKLVLEGLEKRGLQPKDVARITGLPLAKIQRIQVEKASFTNKQLDAIEEATGMSDGQIALLACPGAKDDFIALVNALSGSKSNSGSLIRHA
jgi:hypothetical protein